MSGSHPMTTTPLGVSRKRKAVKQPTSEQVESPPSFFSTYSTWHKLLGDLEKQMDSETGIIADVKNFSQCLESCATLYSTLLDIKQKSCSNLFTILLTNRKNWTGDFENYFDLCVTLPILRDAQLPLNGPTGLLGIGHALIRRFCGTDKSQLRDIHQTCKPEVDVSLFVHHRQTRCGERYPDARLYPYFCVAQKSDGWNDSVTFAHCKTLAWYLQTQEGSWKPLVALQEYEIERLVRVLGRHHSDMPYDGFNCMDFFAWMKLEVLPLHKFHFPQDYIYRCPLDEFLPFPSKETKTICPGDWILMCKQEHVKMVHAGASVETCMYHAAWCVATDLFLSKFGSSQFAFASLANLFIVYPEADCFQIIYSEAGSLYDRSFIKC